MAPAPVFPHRLSSCCFLRCLAKPPLSLASSGEVECKDKAKAGGRGKGQDMGFDAILRRTLKNTEAPDSVACYVTLTFAVAVGTSSPRPQGP
ncbi:hypothetical protein HYQ45_015232 [Verticillium longisporum]|uniref:Uncharacterized protein n=1 Tax=Verticillium longisporum TaxID=100787 RepID=A0A8I2ZAM7_VERLO|nr:hypothetical protein HYQ45_015232 [Verticillium longisporum]